MKKEKITLKKLAHKDAEKLSDLLNASKDVCLTLDIPYPQSIAKQEEYLAMIEQLQKREMNRSFTIRLDKEIIGIISFKNINSIDRYADVGYWMCEEYSGKGYMTEALQQMIAYGFKELKLQKMYAYVCVENLASIKVLKKNTFQKEATLKKHKKWKKRKWADIEIYSKFK